MGNIATPRITASEKNSIAAKELFSINDFCDVHDISRSLFYTLLKEGRAPATTRIGRRRLISAEAAREWRRQHQA